MNFLFALILAALSIKALKCTEPLNVYVRGDMNMIITMPHGGMQQPVNMEDRKKAPGDTSFNPRPDSFTIQLGKALRNELEKRFNLKPHMAYTNVKRKVDFNLN